MAAISIFLYFLLLSFSEATTNGDGHHGFTTVLFHRDSPLSPLYNSSLSPYDRITNALRRSISRSPALLDQAAAAGIQSPLMPNSGEFLMSLSIGTPPMNVIAIADTGSDLTWTQCLPCQPCFNQSLPIFNPRQSSSYRDVSCTSDACISLYSSQCGPDSQTCGYRYGYGDQSYTNGDLGSDKITIGSLQLPTTIIGCSHESSGDFGGVTSGIVGLGDGPLSLVSQMSKTAAVAPQFSYCLPSFIDDANATGKINFGPDAVVSGSQVVSTPLVSKSPDTYYYLTLEAIAVADKRFEVSNHTSSTSLSKGNIIIDSGTTYTFLPSYLLDDIVSTLKSVIKAKPLEDHPVLILEPCYAVGDGIDLDIPVITAHFAGGADVNLPSSNTFVKVADNVTCFSFVEAAKVSIFGNMAQMNFLVGYDLQRKIVSFKPSACS